MDLKSNVIPFPDKTQGLSPQEREVLETILYFFTRTEVSCADCEYTTRSVRQIRANQDAREQQSYAFQYPVSRWSLAECLGRDAGELIVVDLGDRRAFYYHAAHRSKRESSFPSR